jgi:hypothetical protein
MQPKITWSRICDKCVLGGCNLTDLHKAMKWPHKSLRELVTASATTKEHANCTVIHPVDTPGCLKIPDFVEAAWLAMHRPSGCAFLNVSGPRNSIFVVDCEADGDSRYLDLVEDKLATVMCDAVRDACTADFSVFIATACGKVGNLFRSSYRLFFSSHDHKPCFSHLSRVDIADHMRAKLDKIFGSSIDGIPTNKLVDPSFIATSYQHTRAMYCDKREDIHGRKVAHKRPLVPWCVLDKNGNLIREPQCWMCFMKAVDLFCPQDVLTVLKPEFQRQMQVNRIMQRPMTTQKSRVMLNEGISVDWDKEDPRMKIILQMLRPFVGVKVDKLQKVGFSNFQPIHVRVYIEGNKALCQFDPDRVKIHKDNRTRASIYPNGKLLITDLKCSTMFRPAEYSLESASVLFTNAPVFAHLDAPKRESFQFVLPPSLAHDIQVHETKDVIRQLAETRGRYGRKRTIVLEGTLAKECEKECKRFLKDGNEIRIGPCRTSGSRDVVVIKC